VAEFAQALADDFRAAYPDVSFYLTGVAMMNNAFTESTKTDLETLVRSVSLS
jgi:hypothetical protein